jgi:NAD(P)-dependent dehydrogenase (short-subunit alcohol dehydrogenase family)
MKGKIVIITGSNSGICYETALELAKLECTVILGCRDEKKWKEDLGKIKK